MNSVLLEKNPKVLIVDDDDLMREVTTVMIESCGGSVVTAVDGLDAVEIFADNISEIDVVVMDFSMPNMNGYEAYLEMFKLREDLPIIFFSGLPVTPEVSDLCSEGKADFMSKPFKEDDLIGRINKTLKD